jgi:DNA-binding transcriptional LysR family regulator
MHYYSRYDEFFLSMNLAQLEHLVAIAETGSFSRAAERVHLTQPALSRSVRALEDELGGKLIDRVGTSVVQRARQVLSGVLELRHAARHVQAGEVGTIRIGLGSGPSALLTRPLLAYGAQSFPLVRLTVHRGRIDEQLKALRTRELDVVIIDERSVSPHQGLVIERLPDMQVGVFCRAGHPLADRVRVHFDELLRYPVGSTAISDELARHLVESYGAAGHPDNLIALQCDEIAPLIEIAMTSDALFVGLRAAAREALRNGSLVECRMRAAMGTVARFSLVTLEGREASPLLPVVRQLAMQHLTD